MMVRFRHRQKRWHCWGGVEAGVGQRKGAMRDGLIAGVPRLKRGRLSVHGVELKKRRTGNEC